MEKKALVVDENGNNLTLAKDLLDDVNSVKHFIGLFYFFLNCYPQMRNYPAALLTGTHEFNSDNRKHLLTITKPTINLIELRVL